MKKIWGQQKIKKYFNKVSGKHIGTIRNIKMLK